MTVGALCQDYYQERSLYFGKKKELHRVVKFNKNFCFRHMNINIYLIIIILKQSCQKEGALSLEYCHSLAGAPNVNENEEILYLFLS